MTYNPLEAAKNQTLGRIVEVLEGINHNLNRIAWACELIAARQNDYSVEEVRSGGKN